MDFLLECIGFPPQTDLSGLVSTVLENGEPVAWRGPSGVHLRYPLGNGLEVRLDREEDEEHWNLWPWFDAKRRIRVAVNAIRKIEDSPFDVLLNGIANPPPPGANDFENLGEDYPIAACLGDARRLPRKVQPGHVLAISIAGFALDVEYVGPNEGVKSRAILEDPRGASLVPIGGADFPGGAMDVSLRIRAVRRARNPLTDVEVDILEVDAPGRPLELFVSKWQLEEEGLEAPRPGWRVEGVFFFSGRVSGGLPAKAARSNDFG